jgi:hypothetical protein
MWIAGKGCSPGRPVREDESENSPTKLPGQTPRPVFWLRTNPESPSHRYRGSGFVIRDLESPISNLNLQI